MEQTNQSIKKKSQTLRVSEIINQSPVSIIITNTDGEIEYVNKQFTKLTGYCSEEIIGQKPKLLKSGLTPKENFEDLWCKLKQGNCWQGEFINKSKNGNIFWEQAVISPIRDKNDKIIKYIGVKQDITEQKISQELLKQKEEKLVKLNNTKDMFFSIIAHDLKNPLGGLLSLSQLLLENHTKYDDERKDKLFTLMHESSKHTFELLENLLSWARSQKGEMKFNPKKVDLKSIILQNYNDVNNQALKKGITIQNNVLTDKIIFADVDMLNFIFRNILTNAIKFTNRNGNIKIYSKVKNNSISVCIKDDGIGISDKALKKLFKIGCTSTNYGTEDEHGTGLGLILCEEFIKYHNGNIKVTSISGEGSVFCVEIPIKRGKL